VISALLQVLVRSQPHERGAQCQVSCRELEQAEAKARQDRVVMWAQGERYESPAVFGKRMRIAGE
jgi:hypothetical protein